MTIVSALACFNENMLADRIWSQLSLSQLIRLPFIQRFEYIMVSGDA
ncbi:GerAB/ArcD/ProY family transporter [Bacillus cereus]|nr:GerAB/ArcD/ProY family transporter [Bacillus cereus]